VAAATEESDGAAGGAAGATATAPRAQVYPSAVARAQESDDAGASSEDEDGEWPEDGEEGEEGEEEEEEEEEEGEEFVVNGTPLTKDEAARRRARSGYVPATQTNDATMWKAPHVRRSKFVGRPYSCVFGLRRDDPLPPGVIPCPPALAHLTFKCPNGRHTLGSAFKSGGFRRLIKGKEWNALWGKVASGRWRMLESYQKVNHFPGTFQLGRKDALARNVAR
jgi:hypothetical protein